MSRKLNLPQSTPSDNDEGATPGVGDACESGNARGEDLSFEPAELETDNQTPTPNRDVFDPVFLGLSQDFAAEANVSKKWDIIKVEKPTKSRVFLHPTMRLKTMLLVLKEDNEVYLVHPQLRQALAGESLCGLFTLFACVTKVGAPFLWPIRMPDADGKWNIWHQSAWQIAEKAQTRWARMQANRDAGHYVAEYDQRPPEQQQPPEWPNLEWRDWLKLGFTGFIVETMAHPRLKHLHMED
jgi:hypothetical protein